jgi:ATP-dependent RNA helicase DDX27
MLKAAIKHSAGEDNVRHRLVPADVLPKWVKRVEALRDEVATILQEEKEEKQVTWVVECPIVFTHTSYQIRQAEMELKKGQNMIEHQDEIFSRPARTWFQSEKEKAKAVGV